MANGAPTTTFEKGLEAVKQLGAPIAICGVLLWFMITKFDAALVRIDAVLDNVQNMLNENRIAQVEGQQTRAEMRANQERVLKQFEGWMAQGCREALPGPPPGVRQYSRPDAPSP